jgi:hypothetical protein
MGQRKPSDDLQRPAGCANAIRLPHLSTRGTPGDIGPALGRHAREAIHACVGQHLSSELRRWAGTTRLAAIVAAGRSQFPEAYVELEAIAEGAEIDFTDLLLFNCSGDLPLHGRVVDSGCTTIMLPGDPASASPALVLHNEDAAIAAPVPWFIAQLEPSGRPSFTCFCYAGKLPGTAFSVTSRGLVQTINDIRPVDLPVGAPRAFLARAVLDCEDSRHARSLIQATSGAGSYHHAIAWAGDGSLHSIEGAGVQAIIREVVQPIAHANHFVYPPLSGLPQVVVGGSFDRQSFAQEQLAGARASPICVLRATDARGRTLYQLPGPQNGWHKTLATAEFEVHVGHLSWRCVADGDEELLADRVLLA